MRDVVCKKTRIVRWTSVNLDAAIPRKNHCADTLLRCEEDNGVVKLLPGKRDESESFIVAAWGILHTDRPGQQRQRQHQGEHEVQCKSSFQPA